MPVERPVPVKLQILRFLTTHLEGIQGPDWGGYNLEGHIYRGRNRFGDEMFGETFLSILEAPRPDSGREGGDENASRSSEWQLYLQGWAAEPDDECHPLDHAYYLLDQVERRLNMIVSVRKHTGYPEFPELFRCAGLATSFSHGPGVIRPPNDGISSKAYLYIPLRVGLATVV